MMKLLHKVKDWLYSISYYFENLAEMVGEYIYKREPPKKSTMSESMRQFVDEQVLKMTLNDAEHLDKLFPKKTYNGSKIEFRKFSKLPDCSAFKKSFGDVFYIDEDEQG